jgi:hypothetical protein
MSIASRFTNLVVLNLKRDLDGPCRQPRIEAAGELLTIAGILSKYVLRKPGLTTQADVDDALLQGLVRIPNMRPGPKMRDQREFTMPIKPETKIMGYLTSDLGDSTVSASLRRLLEPRLAAVVDDAKTHGKGGISALILDVRPAGTDAVEAVVRHVTVTVTYLGPPAPGTTPPTDKTAPTWGFSYELHPMTFDHEAVTREPGSSGWRQFLQKVPRDDVTRLDGYFEVSVPDSEVSVPGPEVPVPVPEVPEPRGMQAVNIENAHDFFNLREW